MAVIENAKFNGAELLRELAKSGTADAKLALAREVLGFIHRKEKRVAGANEIIDAMEKAGRMEPFLKFPPTPDLTLKKAIALASTGRWEGPAEVKEPTVEEIILAGESVPEPPKPTAAEEAVAADKPEPYTLKESLELKPARGPGRPKKNTEPATAE